ncbi:MAG: hypothetical protein ABII74_09365 [Elusimicrobiota bacterium]
MLARIDLFASFESLDLGGKAAGMAQAFTAISDDVTAIYYNPAGMTQLQQAQFLTDYSRLFFGLADQSDLGYSFFGYIHPLQRRQGKLGVGWLNFDTAGLYSENTFLLSYAQEIRPLFSAGLNLKLLEKKFSSIPDMQNAIDQSENLTGELDPLFKNRRSKSAVTVDAGFLYQALSRYNWGLSVGNLTRPDVSLQGGSEKQPINYKLGVAFREEDDSIALDLVARQKKYSLLVGMEKLFMYQRAALRGGLKLGNYNYHSINLGGGYKYRSWQFDYAFTDFLSEITNTRNSHHFSISWNFEKAKIKPDAQKIIPKKTLSFEERKIMFHIARGIDFFKQSKTAEAIEEFNLILDQDPKNIIARQYLKEILAVQKKTTDENYQKAESLYSSLQWKKAKEIWRQILSADEDQTMAEEKIEKLNAEIAGFLKKGGMYFISGSYSESLAQYQELAKRYEDYPGLGEKIRLVKQKITELEQNDKQKIIDGFVREGEAYVNKQDYKSAWNEWQKALEIAPRNEKVRLVMENTIASISKKAGALYEKFSYASAIELWEKILELRPDNVPARQGIAKAKKDYFNKVEKSYQQAVVTFNEGNYLETIKLCKGILEILSGEPKTKELYVKANVAQGIIYFREDKLKEAIASFNGALKYDPTNERIILYKKRALNKENKLRGGN